MIRYFRIENGRMSPAATREEADVVRLVGPTEAELEDVSSLTSAPLDLLSAACDKDERPRYESEDGVHLVLFRVPHKQSDSAVPVVTIAFGLVLTDSHIVSVCSVDSPVWDVFTGSRAVGIPADNRFMFICRLFMGVSGLYLNYLEFIRSEADRLEIEIHHAMRNEMLIRMLNLEKSLVYFTTSLRGYDSIWPRLKRIQNRPLTEEELDFLEDVRIEFKQAHDLSEIHSNILSGMMDAFASVISNNLNVVMKLLTSVTIILMLPTLVASMYGMNVPLPLQDSPHAFLATIGISGVLSAIGVVLFWKKRFF